TLASASSAGDAAFDAGGELRHRSGREYSIGFGGKAVTRRTRSSGTTLDVDNPDGPDTGFLGLSAGRGVATGRAQTSKALIDVNGDGLPALVRRDGTHINVQLNLGGRFGQEEPFGEVQGAMLDELDGFEHTVEHGLDLPLISLDSTHDA